MIVSKSATNAYLDRRLDSFLWMKKLKREQILRELKHFKVRPEFKTDPWLHQLVCFYIGCCMPEFLFLLDMGLGKSKILADLISQRKRERRLRKALILVPRMINLSSWADDLRRHSDLDFTLVDTEDIEGKWELLQSGKGDVTLIDYQSLQWALCRKEAVTKKRNKLVPDEKRMSRVKRLYNFLGIDESHKLSNDESLWYELVRQLAHAADYRYAATGTVFGRDPAEVFPQFYLIDQGETFGAEMGLFRNAFFTHKQGFAALEFTFIKSRARDFNRMMQNRSIRYEEEEIDELDVPPIVRREILIDMTDEQNGYYLNGIEEIINSEPGEARQTSWASLRRITSGYLKWTDDAGAHKVAFKRNPKLEALENVFDSLGGKKLVLCHEYRDTGLMLSQWLTSKGVKHSWLYGGTKDRAAERRRFLEDSDCQVFLMNSAAGGTGTDGLQTVSHYMVFFESPPSPRDRKQTEKRIQRPGQRQRSFIYDLVVRRSVDRTILDSIQEGRDLFDEIVNGGKKITRGLLGR